MIVSLTLKCDWAGCKATVTVPLRHDAAENVGWRQENYGLFSLHLCPEHRKHNSFKLKEQTERSKRRPVRKRWAAHNCFPGHRLRDWKNDDRSSRGVRVPACQARLDLHPASGELLDGWRRLAVDDVMGLIPNLSLDDLMVLGGREVQPVGEASQPVAYALPPPHAAVPAKSTAGIRIAAAVYLASRSICEDADG
jgi:hypothetical protein